MLAITGRRTRTGRPDASSAMTHHRFAVCLLLPLTACATRFQHYDFAQARLPGGGYDTAKLIAELKASGANGLQDGSWFPLIHLERTEFAPTSANLPDGYVLTTVSASGPIFFTGRNDRRIVDGKGALVESAAGNWFGWGLLHHAREQDIATTHGLRRQTHGRTLLLFGGNELRYRADAPATNDAPPASAATTPAAAK